MNKIYEDDLIDCIQIARYQLGSDSFSVFKTKKKEVKIVVLRCSKQQTKNK